MNKILFYINAINGGGAERVMTNLSAQFADDGYNCIFVTSYRELGEYVLSPKVKRISLEDQEIVQNRIMRNYTRIRKLRNVCKAEKPDLVLAFMGEPNFRAILATRGLPCKVVISVRNDPSREYAGVLRRLIANILFPLADGCVFQTESAKMWFPRRLQCKSSIIMNAVNPVFYSCNREPKENLIVSCGRLTSQKNHRLLIEAFNILQKRVADARLFIYGEGDLKEELKGLIVKSKLEGKVILKGQVKDVVSALREADLFVLCSDYEGMPNALMEALAVGVPSISTDCPCGGPRLLISSGKNGILVPTNNAVNLADAMIELLSNREKMRVMGVEGRKSAEKYKPEEIYQKWKQYFTQVIERQ